MPEQSAVLKEFRNKFLKHRKIFKACCYLFGNRVLTVKATALQKNDIDQLPWPDDLKWMLAEWEGILIDDIVEYVADYVRLGQESALLTQEPSQEDTAQYCDVFLKMMKKTYPEMNVCGNGQSNGLRFQAFCFGDKKETEWLDGSDWLNHLRSTIFKEYGEALRTVRILRIYDRNALILIKPNVLRYWIGSTAIRDVDDTIGDILSAGSDVAK